MLRTCCVLAQILIVSAAAYAQPRQLSPVERSGRKILQTRCAMCHVGQDPATELATDTGARRPSTFGPLLSKAQAANEDALRDKIKNGGARMPAYKLSLTDDDVNAVIAFLKTIERPLTKLALDRAGE